MSKIAGKIKSAIGGKDSDAPKLNPIVIDKSPVLAAPQKDGQRTPADEAIFFFESSPSADSKPVQVWELRLEEDGAPSKDKAVRISVAF